MVTVMVTDFLQAQFINIVFLVVMFALLAKFAWGDVEATLAAAPAGKSLINPFDQSGIADFNLWFFMIFAFKLFYNRLGWQGTQGYNCAAKTPHEAKMAGVLAEWRGGVSYLILMLMPIGAYVLLHNPMFASEAAGIQQTLSGITDPQTQKQMTVPIALVHMLPAGMIGLLCAAMLAATVGNDTTFLHAWGSIFIQDVVLPFRRKPLTPTQHLRLLRLSVLGVAVFAFCFSLVFPLRDYVVMYQLVTGAIYLGGSGAVIIGGLYWSRATTAGAWWGLWTGGVLATAGALLRVLVSDFPINGAWVALIASISAIVAFVVASLLTCRQPFNMDKLLHRGEYATEPLAALTKAPGKWKWFGVTSEFSRGDRVIYALKIGWTGFWVAAFIVGTILALTVGVSNGAWAKWWLFQIVVGAVVGVITIVWFLIGGMKDLKDLMNTLRNPEREETDNGTVPAKAAATAEARSVTPPTGEPVTGNVVTS
jgi:SSS family solute:Na+ symporter